MQDYIRERVLKGANYLIENKCTMEEVAKEIGISETTVHIDLRQRLEEVNPGLKRITDTIIEGNIARGKVKGGLTMAKRRREEGRSRKEPQVDQGECIFKDMRNEDKLKLVVEATKKGINIEKELIPILRKVGEVKDKSLLIKNYRYIRGDKK